MLIAFVEEVSKCVRNQERGKWICAAYRKQGEGGEFNLLVLRVTDINRGGLKNNNEIGAGI